MKLTVVLLSVTCLLTGIIIHAFKHNYSTNEYLIIAKEGVKKFKPLRKDRAIVIDFRKSLLQERLYVIDLNENNFILSSPVSHALRSGFLYATNFSNEINSFKSCTGYFITDNEYTGKYGKSMRIQGLEKGKNDNTWQRAIVFHDTELPLPLYSNGCFVTNEDINDRMVTLTKDGCLLVVLK